MSGQETQENKLSTIQEVSVNETSTDDNVIIDNLLATNNELLDKLSDLYKYIKSIHGEKITPANIVLIASELIQIVEKYKTLTGSQKKMLVINTIKKYVNEQNTTSDEKLALNIIIDNTLPHIIDGFVSAINGLLNFSKKVKKSKLCCFSLCG
jgi:DNA mismatch repair ATPase MutS